MNKSPLYISGADGFLGSHLVSSLGERYSVVPIVRNVGNGCSISIADFLKSDSLGGTFIHTAGLSHSIFSKEEFFATNVDLTLELAKKCISLGISKFIFISSISIYGRSARYIDNSTMPCPDTVYGESKLEAERKLQALFMKGIASSLIIVRPPMIYGPSAKGSYSKLVGFIRRSILLPLGGIDNRRSFVGVYNLIDFLGHCIATELPSDAAFLVSDGDDMSSSDFVSLIADNENPRICLLAIPRILKMVSFLLSVLGNTTLRDSVLADSEVSISGTIDTTGWQPKYTVKSQLARYQLDR